jgi:hypothetical protein
MSPSSSALASTSTVFRSGCGWLATGLLASRLSEKLRSTARASGVLAAAMNCWLRAISWTWLKTRLNSTTCERPMRPPLPIIKPPKRKDSPIP